MKLLDRRVGLGLVIALAGVAAWPLLGDVSDAALRAVANGVIGRATFGAGGHVAFLPASARNTGSAYDDDASWSTHLELRVDGVPARERVRINARRLLYLPSVLLAAIVLASSLTPRRKVVALAAGAVALCGAALLSCWIIAAWLFAQVPGLVYELSTFQQRALRFGYEAWVSSLGNRFITPIVAGAALVLLLSRPRRLSARR